MSQVVTRPSSQVRTNMFFPQIKHPLSGMENPDSMDVRGLSRAGEARSTISPHVTGRPLANEGSLTARRSFSGENREVKATSRNKENHVSSILLQNIPEGTEVKYGDPSATRLPIFGGRAGVVQEGQLNRASSRTSSGQTRLEIDEIETHIKNKICHNFYEIRKKFKDNDPEGLGNVSREALARILATYLGRPISGSTCQRLLERLGLADRQIISYSEFFSHFREAGECAYPQWMDPVHRPHQNRVLMTCEQVHANLRETARQRFLNLADMMPQLKSGDSDRLTKPQFRQMLNNMNFCMDDSEFESLWKRYASDKDDTISGERLLNALGIEWRDKSAETPKQKSPLKADSTPKETRLPRKKELERQHQLNVEIWLKNKFREGFFNMRDAFQTRDPDKTGLVTFDDFIQVLAQFGLKLEKKLLGAFLSRCSVEAVDKRVPYREFLHRFQDRGEGSITHNLLHGVNKDENKDNCRHKMDASFSTLQSQMTNMFQRDYLALLEMFKQIDSLGSSVVSQEEFRAVIESRFDLELTDTQFQSFIDHVPLDDEGKVMYVTFMSQFDGRGQAPSLFGTGSDLTDSDKENLHGPLGNTGRQNVSDNHVTTLLHQPGDINLEVNDPHTHRSTEELFKLIKDLMSRNFHELEQKFYKLDEKNTRRLTQDTMYHLLKSCDIHPEISRGEIRDLWSTFITKSDKTLDYLQFVRHFGFSKRSATFPNAKLQPPRRGDADFMIRSKRLNCAADILQDNLRAKVDYLWDDLRREFAGMDPYSTGCVSKEEFVEVLTELCPSLDNTELKHLTDKFKVKNDGRISYLEFLKPFALKRLPCRHDNILSVLQQSQTELPASDNVQLSQVGLPGITAKLREKLSGEWKNLRRAFKKLDVAGHGFLSLPEFRAVLKLANVVLDEDEVYHVMNEFDPDLAGKISYDKFIDETFKPGSKNSVRSK